MKKMSTLICSLMLLILSTNGYCLSKNLIVEYFNNADFQCETNENKKNVRQALSDMLKLSPEELKQKRYANYQMKKNQWTITELLERHFVPDKTLSLTRSEDKFYKEVSTPEAKKAILYIIGCIDEGINPSMVY